MGDIALIYLGLWAVDNFACLIRNELLNDTCTDNAAYWKNKGKYGAVSIGIILTLYNPGIAIIIIPTISFVFSLSFRV